MSHMTYEFLNPYSDQSMGRRIRTLVTFLFSSLAFAKMTNAVALQHCSVRSRLLFTSAITNLCVASLVCTLGVSEGHLRGLKLAQTTSTNSSGVMDSNT